MANKPDDPHQPAPDDKKKRGPQSSGSIEGLEGAAADYAASAGLPKPKVSFPSEESIDLGNPGEGVELSGVSVIEWASLAEAPPSSAKHMDSLNSASDSDPLGQLADRKDAPPARTAPPTMVAKPGEMPSGSPRQTVVAKPGDLAASLGAPGAGSKSTAGPKAGKPTATAHGAPPPKEDSGIDLTEDAIIVEEEAVVVVSDDSVIDLTEDAVIVEVAGAPGMMPAGSDSVIDLGIDEGGIDVVAEPVSKTSGKHKPASGVDIAEDAILEELPATAANGGSSRDLIAEDLESGVGLPTGKKHQGTKTPAAGGGKKTMAVSDDALDDFLSPTGEDHSSSVDLGSVHNLNVFDSKNLPYLDSRPSTQSDSNLHLEKNVETAAPEGDVVAVDSGLKPVKKTTTKEKDADQGVDVVETADVEVEDNKPKKKGKAAAKSDDQADGAEDGEPKKKSAPKPRGQAGAWLGGTVLGAVVGTAACAGLWFFGIVGGAPAPAPPPPKIGPGPGPGVNNAGPGPAAAAATFAGALDHIKNGDLDRVKPEDLARAEKKPEHQVALAEYHWLSYLKSERGKNPKAVLKADAEPVKKALAELNTAIAAKNADALFLRGQIHEMTGKPDEARKDYAKGLQDFKTDPVQTARFQTALLVLDLTPKMARLAPAGMPPRLLALLLIAFQPPPPESSTPPAGDEAGFAFWKSIKAARDGNYAEAVKLLDEARNRHDKRRYLVPRKQQNPLSDPREEIFLRTADEVKAYWMLLARLGSPGYLTADAAERDKMVDALLKKAEEAAAAAQLKDLSAKLVKDKPVAKVEDLIKLMTEDRKVSADKIVALEGSVTDQKKKAADLEEKLTKSNKELSETQNALKTAETHEKELQTANAAASAALKEVGEAAGVKFVDLKTSRDSLVKGVQECKRAASVVDPKGIITKLERELVADRAKLKDRWEPEQMLVFWLPILQADRSRADLGAKAVADAERVLKDPASTDAQKGRALAIEGLVLRNSEKFDAAKNILEKAKASLRETKGDWLAQTEAALREVSDPGADLAGKADALVSQGKPTEAIALLERGLKSGSGSKGALYAQRALIALEAARAKGPLAAADPQVQTARKDAAEAAKEGLAVGHYVSGRLAEELGQIDEAIKSYRAAIAALKAGDEMGSRYRIALARALLKSRSPEAPGAPSRASKESIKPAKEIAAARMLSILDFTSLLTALTFQGADLPTTGPIASEAEKLADEVLKDDKAPFDVKAQALAVKGLYTRALLVFTTGLRDKGLLAPGYANALLDLIDSHPALKRPESKTVPEPAEGEKYYAAGVNFFFAHRYGDAEKSFLSAVENDNADARYYYFLGLSRLAQNKREAFEDFDQAARLERLGRPSRAAVSNALERVQGTMRQVLNEVRTRPVKDKAK